MVKLFALEDDIPVIEEEPNVVHYDEEDVELLVNGIEVGTEQMSNLIRVDSILSRYTNIDIASEQLALISLESCMNTLGISLEEEETKEPSKDDKKEETKEPSKDEPKDDKKEETEEKEPSDLKERGVVGKVIDGIKKIWNAIVNTLKSLWKKVSDYLFGIADDSTKKKKIKEVEDLRKRIEAMSFTNDIIIDSDNSLIKPYSHLNKELSFSFFKDLFKKYDDTLSFLKDLTKAVSLGADKYHEQLSTLIKNEVNSTGFITAGKTLLDDFKKEYSYVINNPVLDKDLNEADKEVYKESGLTNTDTFRKIDLLFKNKTVYSFIKQPLKPVITLIIKSNEVKEDNKNAKIVIKSKSELMELSDFTLKNIELVSIKDITKNIENINKYIEEDSKEFGHYLDNLKEGDEKTKLDNIKNLAMDQMNMASKLLQGSVLVIKSITEATEFNNSIIEYSLKDKNEETKEPSKDEPKDSNKE